MPVRTKRGSAPDPTSQLRLYTSVPLVDATRDYILHTFGNNGGILLAAVLIGSPRF